MRLPDGLESLTFLIIIGYELLVPLERKRLNAHPNRDGKRISRVSSCCSVEVLFQSGLFHSTWSV